MKDLTELIGGYISDKTVLEFQNLISAESRDHLTQYPQTPVLGIKYGHKMQIFGDKENQIELLIKDSRQCDILTIVMSYDCNTNTYIGSLTVGRKLHILTISGINIFRKAIALTLSFHHKNEISGLITDNGTIHPLP